MNSAEMVPVWVIKSLGMDGLGATMASTLVWQ